MNEFVIFDTEYTAWEGSQESGWTKKGEYQEIIQIGGIRVNKDGMICEKFNVFVKPKINIVLSDYISKLTGISQNTIDELGVSLSIAIKEFDYFCRGQNKILAISNGGDEKIIFKNLQLNGSNYEFKNIIFFDFQLIIKNLINSTSHLSIEKLCAKLGITSRHHSAIQDSELILKIIIKMNLLPSILNIR